VGERVLSSQSPVKPPDYPGEESERLFNGIADPETPHLNPLPQGERKDGNTEKSLSRIPNRKSILNKSSPCPSDPQNLLHREVLREFHGAGTPLGLGWPLSEGMDEVQLDRLLFPPCRRLAWQVEHQADALRVKRPIEIEW